MKLNLGVKAVAAAAEAEGSSRDVHVWEAGHQSSPEEVGDHHFQFSLHILGLLGISEEREWLCFNEVPRETG